MAQASQRKSSEKPGKAAPAPQAEEAAPAARASTLPRSLDPRYLQQRVPADLSLRNRAVGTVGHPVDLSRDLAEIIENVITTAREEFEADLRTRVTYLKKAFDQARDNPLDAMMFPSAAEDHLFEIKGSGAIAGVPGVGALASSLYGFLRHLNPSEDKHLAITGLIIDSMQLALASSNDQNFRKAVDEMIRLAGRAIAREMPGTR